MQHFAVRRLRTLRTNLICPSTLICAKTLELLTRSSRQDTVLLQGHSRRFPAANGPVLMEARSGPVLAWLEKRQACGQLSAVATKELHRPEASLNGTGKCSPKGICGRLYVTEHSFPSETVVHVVLEQKIACLLVHAEELNSK